MGELYFGWVSILRDDECSHGRSNLGNPALEKIGKNREQPARDNHCQYCAARIGIFKFLVPPSTFDDLLFH